MNFEIPEKVWFGKDPSYSHLKVFGCLAFAHVSKERRQKLDARITPCIFIGYGDEEFGYRLLDPKERKVFRSRDVIFQENQTYEDLEKLTVTKGLIIKDIVPDPAPTTMDDAEVHEHFPEDLQQYAQEVIESWKLQ